MSSAAASAVLSPSSTTTGSPSLRQHPASDLFSKYTLPNSPAATSTVTNYSQINKISSTASCDSSTASINRPHRRWRAVLDHLVPPRLLPLPKRAAPSASTLSAPSPRQKLSTSHQASNSLPPTLPDDTAWSAENGADNQLLQTLLKKMNAATTSDEYGGQRTTTLSKLCTLCASTPDAADLCVAANGIHVILDVLTSSSAELRQLQAVSAADFLNVEVNEKALLLLQVLTSSSHNGCEALLRNSSTVAILGKKVLRVSEACTASTIAILLALCQHSDAANFRKTVSATVIPSKLVLVLQVASRDSTKRRAGRLLRLLLEDQQAPSSKTTP